MNFFSKLYIQLNKEGYIPVNRYTYLIGCSFGIYEPEVPTEYAGEYIFLGAFKHSNGKIYYIFYSEDVDNRIILEHRDAYKILGCMIDAHKG